MSQPSHDVRAVVRALDALTTQVRRLADARPTPAVEQADDTDDAPTTTARRPVSLATPCARCPHPYNWHTPGNRCTSLVKGSPCPCAEFSPCPTPETHNWGCGCASDKASTADTGGYPDQPYPADGEDTLRADRRASIRNLIGRAAAGLTPDEDALLRQHVEAEIREADQWRAGRNTMKQRGEEIEQDRDRLASELEQAQDSVERARKLCADPVHRFTIARADVLAALDGTEQPTTTKEN